MREQRYRAATITVDWDSRSRYPSRRYRRRTVDIATHIAELCEARLGRPLTEREWRAVQGQIEPQIRAARARFLKGAFAVPGRGDARTPARWAAQRLLYPERSFEQIAMADQLAGRGSPDGPAVRNACRAFVVKANLVLP